MKINEKQALLNYLEFHLVTLVEGVERHINDPDIVGDLYDKAYNILVDVEDAIQVPTVSGNSKQRSK